MKYFSLLALIFLPVAVLSQGYVPAGEVRAIEQAFVDGEQTGAAMNGYGGGYGGGYGYNSYGYGGYNPYGYGGYWGKK